MTKTNWELDRPFIEKQGIFSDALPKDIFDWLKIKCVEAKKKKIDASKRLIGHISQEYFLRDLENEDTYFKLQNWLSQQCFNPTFNMFDNHHYILSEDRPLKIWKMWVNFQKKYEFNPPHTHGGIFSFIVFVKIPYKLEDETNYFTTEEGVASKLYFQTQVPIHLNRSGIYATNLNVDKSFEGKILIFPSTLTHGVHPFYTSDDYRITISGNLVFDV